MVMNVTFVNVMTASNNPENIFYCRYSIICKYNDLIGRFYLDMFLEMVVLNILKCVALS